MKELIPKDEYGIFADAHDTARVDSLFVAQAFEKEHFHVLRDIAKITDTKSGFSEDFGRLNFQPASYFDTWSGTKVAYLLRDIRNFKEMRNGVRPILDSPRTCMNRVSRNSNTCVSSFVRE